MIRALPLLVLVLAAAGCSTVKTTTRTHRATLADNHQDFDRYVERRTESLHQSGVFKDRSEAEFKARSEATHRFGERTPDVTTSWSWGGDKDRKLTLADYDKMTRDAASRR